MSATINRFALAALACAIVAPASAQLIPRKDLSYATAKAIAENANPDTLCTRAPAKMPVLSNRNGESWSTARPMPKALPACGVGSL